MPCFIVRPENMHIISKPESSGLSCGLEFDEAVGLKRPNLQDLRLHDLRRLGLLSPTAVPKRCKRSKLSGFGIICHLGDTTDAFSPAAAGAMRYCVGLDSTAFRMASADGAAAFLLAAARS